jgi:hypothetical protein
MTFHLGKQAATYDKRDALYADFRRSLAAAGKLPKVPTVFGHGNDFADWLMLGNGPDPTVAPGFEGCGDCAWAGPAHETMELCQNAKRPAPRFDGKTVVDQYSEYSGYDPETGANDTGSNVREVLQWRATKGLKDADGTVHKIGPYVALEPKNLEHLLEAAYLFECVGIGIEVPESAQQQFAEGKPWSVVPGAQIEGGHYIPVVGRPNSMDVAFITWAQRTLMTDQFYATFNDEAWAYISPEQFKAVTGRDYEGYDEAQLEEYLHLVATN